MGVFRIVDELSLNFVSLTCSVTDFLKLYTIFFSWKSSAFQKERNGFLGVNDGDTEGFIKLELNDLYFTSPVEFEQ